MFVWRRRRPSATPLKKHGLYWLSRTWSGQTWSWPNLVWPNLVLAKLGLAKLGNETSCRTRCHIIKFRRCQLQLFCYIVASDTVRSSRADEISSDLWSSWDELTFWIPDVLELMSSFLRRVSSLCPESLVSLLRISLTRDFFYHTIRIKISRFLFCDT